MEKRDGRLWIRVSKTELEQLQEKGKQYGSVSSLIRKSIEYMDDADFINNENRKRQLIEVYSKLHMELSHIGNNINQIAHSMNILKNENVVYASYLSDIVLPQIAELQSVLQRTNIELYNITKITVRTYGKSSNSQK